MAPRSWSVKSREVLSRQNVFDVVRGEYVRSDGFSKSMMTLACPDWANVVALTAERQIVLVRQYRPGPELFTLETPGGVVEAGEEPLVTAHRELLEETGYRAASMEPLGWAYPNPALQGNRIHFFLAEGVTRAQDPTFDGVGEECEIVVLPFERLDELTEREGFGHALCWAALARAERRLALRGQAERR